MKRAGCVARSHVQSYVPLPLNMQAAVFGTDQWLWRWCREKYGPKHGVI